MSPKSLTKATLRPERLLTRLKLTHKAAIGYDIYLACKDQANATKILEMMLEARARNTDKNYIPKQQEFIAWALRSCWEMLQYRGFDINYIKRCTYRRNKGTG